MSEEELETEVQIQSPLRQWTRRILKITFALGVLFAVVFFTLGNISRFKEPLQDAAQKYLSDITGYESTIIDFNGMYFFPLVMIDFENLEMRNPSEVGPVITAQSIFMAASFFDVMGQSGRFKAFQIKELIARPNTITDQALGIEIMEIVEDEDGTAWVRANGVLGTDEAFTFQIPLEKKGKESYRFIRQETYEITLSSGEKIPLEIKGRQIHLVKP